MFGLFKKRKKKEKPILTYNEAFVQRFLREKSIWYSEEIGSDLMRLPPKVGPLMVELLDKYKKTLEK